MHRIDADAHVANQFSEGDPTVPRLPTRIDAAWLNAVQEELAQLVTTAGAALIKGTTQLPTLLANLSTAQTFTAVKTFAAGLVSSALATFNAGISCAATSGAAGAAATTNTAYPALRAERTGGTATDDALYVGGVSSLTGQVWAGPVSASATAAIAPLTLQPTAPAPTAPTAGALWHLDASAGGLIGGGLFHFDGTNTRQVYELIYLTADPSGTVWEGMLYYNTTTHRLRCFDGSAWNNLW